MFERLGLRSEVQGKDVIVPGNQKLMIRNDAGDHMPKVEDGPWPAFPADLTSIARRARDTVGGLGRDPREDVRKPPVFCDKLQLMGAAITICDPHRAIVLGPRRLAGQRVESPDIRAGMRC